MQKVILLSLIGLILLFMLQLRDGSGGYKDNERILHQVAMQEDVNESLDYRNSMLKIKIEGLKGSVDSLDARARFELNLVKPGEILVVLPGNYVIKVNQKNKQ